MTTPDGDVKSRIQKKMAHRQNILIFGEKPMIINASLSRSGNLTSHSIHGAASLTHGTSIKTSGNMNDDRLTSIVSSEFQNNKERKLAMKPWYVVGANNAWVFGLTSVLDFMSIFNLMVYLLAPLKMQK